MYRAVYYFGSKIQRITVESLEMAKALAVKSGALGVSIIQRPMEESPSSYLYYIVVDKDLMGCGKMDFMSICEG
jgi:hypothetical protein